MLYNISTDATTKRMNIYCTYCGHITYDKLDIHYNDLQYNNRITRNHLDEFSVGHYCRWCNATRLHNIIPNKMMVLLDTLREIENEYKFTVECSVGDLDYTIKRTKSDRNKLYNLKGNKLSSGPVCLPYIEFVFLKKNRYHIDKFKLKLNNIFENNGFRCIVVNDNIDENDILKRYYENHYVIRYEYNGNILDTLVNSILEYQDVRYGKFEEFGFSPADINNIELVSYVMMQSLHQLIDRVLDRLRDDIKAEQNKL